MSANEPTVAQEAVVMAGMPQEGLPQLAEALAPKSASELSGGVGTSMPMSMRQPMQMQGGGLLGDQEDMDFSNMSMEEMAEFVKKMKGLSEPMEMQKGGQTIGFRQNNPGNIRPTGEFIGETGQGGGYATFKNPIFGGRALSRILSTYKRDYGINNIDAMIDRYAPKKDNTEASRKNYKSFIARDLGVSTDSEIDLDDDNTKAQIMKSIVKFENKNQQPFTDQDYNLMIQSSKTDDPSVVNELIVNYGRESFDDDDGGLGLIRTAVAGPKKEKDNSMAGEFGPAGLDRPDMFLPRFLAGKRSLQPGEIGFEAAYGAGLRPFDESDEVSGSKLPKPLTSYQDLLNLEKASRAQAGFIDSKDVFGEPAVDTNEGEIITKDGKQFVKTNVTEKDASGKTRVVKKEVELKKDGTVKDTTDKNKKDQDTTRTFRPAVGSVPGTSTTSSLEQDIINLQERLQKDKEVDKYLALARAGLALADPTKTISEAAGEGLDAVAAARKRYTEGVIDLINARAKLAKASKKGLTLPELFTNLNRFRTLKTEYAKDLTTSDPEAVKNIDNNIKETLRLIREFPGYANFREVDLDLTKKDK
jgi:hypothetical protein